MVYLLIAAVEYNRDTKTGIITINIKLWNLMKYINEFLYVQRVIILIVYIHCVSGL